MEEGEYRWMWTKRKHSLSSIILASSTPTPTSTPLFNSLYDHHESSSWEEQAFAEDGRVGGCIWPPTSYSCSFCNREFKSAQALGGHMNVHRRDRAILKQPPTSPHNNNIDQSAEPETAPFDHQLMIPPFTSSLGSLCSSNSTTTTTTTTINPNSSHLDAASKAKLGPPMSLNLGEDHRFYSQKLDLRADQHKRRRVSTTATDTSSTPLFFTKSISIENRDHHHHHHHHIKSQKLGFISPSSINEELDLELRLGHSTPN